MRREAGITRGWSRAWLTVALWAAAACTDEEGPKVEEPVAPAAATVDAPADAGAEPSAPAKPAGDPNCHVLSKMAGDPPFYVAGKGVVLTRVMKTCVAPDGRRGVDKTTPWLAMGFPCTGGGGRIEIKGHYHNPKMVSFIVGTDCAMAPPGREQAQRIVTEAVGMPAEAKLMAFTPFVVQFWEVTGMTDTDTGFSIDLRSAPATEGSWKRFRENQPLRVRLYGRENAWVEGGHFYQVDADLVMTGRNAFRLEVAGVKNLSEAELAQLKGRCEALRPQRNCGAVF